MDKIEFKDGVGIVDLPTLERTARYEGIRGNLPKTRPIEHHQLIRNVLDNIKSNISHGVVTDPIYASERQAMRVMWNGEKEECPVENYLIQRLVTKIMIGDTEKGLNSAVAISYTEKGIQIAFGTNVHSCTNLMIWGQNLMSTFGHNKVNYDAMMDAFDDWMKRFEEKRAFSLDVIAQLKKRKVKEPELFEMLGKLIYEAERSNYSGGNGSSLNVSQTLRLIDNYEKEREEKKVVTAWDICNWGTNGLKPEQDAKDLTQIYDTTHKFSNTIAGHFLPELNLN